MTYKKLIPCFGCQNEQAFSLVGKERYQRKDSLLLSRFYNDNGADELLIWDLSQSDEEHEKTIGILKEIARNVDLPFMTGGRVKRMEDIKKYLYAGAQAVFLDVSDEEQVDLIKEGADRFGSEKIYVYLPDPSYLSRVEEYAQLGASMALLEGNELGEKEQSLMALSPIPFLIFGCETDMAFVLSIPCASGVLLKLLEGEEDSLMDWKQELKKQGISVDTFESQIAWSGFHLNPQGLIPVIVQDYKTSEVLMLAYMNEEAFHCTLSTGKMTYFSRSRQKLWIKGETSGHYQYVKALSLDCDNDTLLAKVRQVGAACHTGARSCFFQTLAKKEYRETNPLMVFEEVLGVIQDRKENPKEGSYTNYLFDKGLDKILKKLGEEATEIVIAAKNRNPEEVKYEISDFLYHMMVLMAYKGISWEEITKELAGR